MQAAIPPYPACDDPEQPGVITRTRSPDARQGAQRDSTEESGSFFSLHDVRGSSRTDGDLDAMDVDEDVVADMPYRFGGGAQRHVNSCSPIVKRPAVVKIQQRASSVCYQDGLSWQGRYTPVHN